jgi:isoquinoline 1-oxidoreductase beta subunit
MAVAVIVRPPVFGGSVAGFDAAAALAVHGVKAVLALPQPSGPPAYQPVGGVAVVGENTWAAIQGRLKLTVSWNHGANATYDSDADRAALLQAVAREGKACRDHGDVAHALGLAARTVEAAYFVPHLAHTPMEPPVTLAHFANGSCEVWSCTQNPQDTQAQVAATVGVDPSKVTVHATLVGGAFGRKSIPDYAAEAAWLSLKLGIPVRVQWTRDDDIRQDCYHAISAQQMTAGLDETGRVIALRHRTAFPSLTTLFMSGVTAPSNDELSMGVLDLPLATENFRTETCDASPHLRIGWVRSVANIHHAFAIGSFFDEIAAARGMDPRESLLDVLGPPRKLTSQSDFGTTLLDNYGVSLESHPIDVGRYHGVIERVTAMAGWSERHRDGRALGLAVHRCFLTYVAAVVSVKQRADGFWADEIWMAADVGTAVNPERVRAQMESAAISGLSLALYGGITVRQGAVQESNFHEYRIVRIGDAPTRIHVQLIASTELPGGAGEPGVPPIAPALCNAIFAATGKRIRELPIAARGGAAR